MANVLTDTAVPLSVATYLSAHLPDMEVPPAFKHTPPDSKPTEPDPSALTGPELAEVAAWKDGLVAPTLAAAITYVANYVTYINALEAWQFANRTARKTQYRLAVSDSTINNIATVSQSGTSSGAGSTPPGPAVYPRQTP